MTDRSDATAPLTHDLAAAARTLDIPPGDPAAAVLRGGRRRQRQRRGFTGLAVVALVATVAGAVSVLDDPAAQIDVATSAGLTRDDVGVTWRAVSPESGLGYAPRIGSSTPLYALSTAAGQREVSDKTPRVLWRSDDGVEWTAVATASDDLFVSDLVSRDDRVYAVGTGLAGASVGGKRAIPPLMVGWSDDGAKTWDKARLPLDLEGLMGKTLRLNVASSAVASGPAGTVIAGVLDGALDVPALLPAGVAAPDGWSTTATGVDILGPEKDGVCPAGTLTPEEAMARRGEDVKVVPVEPAGAGEVYPTTCMPENLDMSKMTRESMVQVSPQEARGVVASYGWDQLGVSGDLLRAVRRQPVAFFAEPGSTDFSRVDLPDLDPMSGPILLDAGDGGFDLVSTTTVSSTYREMEGVKVMVLHSDNGRSWTAAPATGAALWASAAGTVGGVPTVIGQSADGASMLRSTDGGWVSASLTSVVSDLPAGANVSLMHAAIGPFGAVATLAVQPQMSEAELTTRPTDIDERVLVSRDGTTWQEYKVGDLAGRPVRNIIRATVVGDRVAVTVLVKPESGEGSAQLVLVGTPT